MILSFSDADTEELFRTEKNRRLSHIARVATRKLTALDAAEQIEDLAVPPGNRLQPLRGGGEGWHSIRINDQWRLVFQWTGSGPAQVAILDYH